MNTKDLMAAAIDREYTLDLLDEDERLDVFRSDTDMGIPAPYEAQKHHCDHLKQKCGFCLPNRIITGNG